VAHLLRDPMALGDRAVAWYADAHVGVQAMADPPRANIGDLLDAGDVAGRMGDRVDQVSLDAVEHPFHQGYFVEPVERRDQDSRLTAIIPVGNAPRKIAVQPVSSAGATTPAPMRAASALSAKNKSVTLAGTTYADHGTKDVRNLSKLELEADDNYFSPTFLRGKPGQKLTLLVESEGSALHNISIPALGIDKDIPQRARCRWTSPFPPRGCWPSPASSTVRSA